MDILIMILRWIGVLILAWLCGKLITKIKMPNKSWVITKTKTVKLTRRNNGKKLLTSIPTFLITTTSFAYAKNGRITKTCIMQNTMFWMKMAKR